MFCWAVEAAPNVVAEPEVCACTIPVSIQIGRRMSDWIMNGRISLSGDAIRALPPRDGSYESARSGAKNVRRHHVARRYDHACGMRRIRHGRSQRLQQIIRQRTERHAAA